MTTPNYLDLVEALSIILSKVLKNHHRFKYTETATSMIYNEHLYPLEPGVDIDHLPESGEIKELLVKIFEKQRLQAECVLMSAVYIDRLLNATKLTLTPANWRRILIAALLLADKVWEDTAVWNIDYKKMFPNLTLEDLNRLELTFLTYIEFNLVIKPSTYAQYFFELRSKLDSRKYQCILKPLDKKTALKLESLSIGLEEKLEMCHIKEQRSKSLMPYASPVGQSHLSFEEFRRYMAETRQL